MEASVCLSRFRLLRNLKRRMRADHCGAQPAAKIRSDPTLQSYHDCSSDISTEWVKYKRSAKNPLPIGETSK